MTIIFLQLTRNNMIGSEILFLFFLLMLKFQLIFSVDADAEISTQELSFPIKENFLELLMLNFSVDAAEISTQELSLPIKENFLELRNDRTLRLKFPDITLDEFWIAVGKEYRQISEKTLEILLQFCTTYLCEQSFSTLVLIKNDKRSCLKEIDRELRVAISNIEPNMQRLSSLRQPQASH